MHCSALRARQADKCHSFISIFVLSATSPRSIAVPCSPLEQHCTLEQYCTLEQHCTVGSSTAKPFATKMPSAALLAMHPGWSGSSHPHHRKHSQSRPALSLELHDLSATNISRLTSILSNASPPSFPPTAVTVQTYRNGTKSLIHTLPDSLLTPVPYQAQIVGLLNKYGAECPGAARSCKLHKRLNAQLVSDILGRIKDEIEGHLPRIMRLFPQSPPPGFEHEKGTWPTWPACVEKKKVESPEEGARKVLLALQAVHGMYVPASTFRSFHARDPPARCVFQTDECAACILARIGSDAEAVVGLRALFLGRGWSDAKVRKSKRLLWVESWIMAFGAEAAREMLERSEKVGDMVQRKRKEKKGEEMEGEGRDGRSGTQTKTTAHEVSCDMNSSSSTLVSTPPLKFLPTAAPRPCSSGYSDRHQEIHSTNRYTPNPLHQRVQQTPLPPPQPSEFTRPNPRPTSSIYSRATHDFSTANLTSSTPLLPPRRRPTAAPLQPVHKNQQNPLPAPQPSELTQPKPRATSSIYSRGPTVSQQPILPPGPPISLRTSSPPHHRCNQFTKTHLAFPTSQPSAYQPTPPNRQASGGIPTTLSHPRLALSQIPRRTPPHHNHATLTTHITPPAQFPQHT